MRRAIVGRLHRVPPTQTRSSRVMTAMRWACCMGGCVQECAVYEVPLLPYDESTSAPRVRLLLPHRRYDLRILYQAAFSAHPRPAPSRGSAGLADMCPHAQPGRPTRGAPSAALSTVLVEHGPLTRETRLMWRLFQCGFARSRALLGSMFDEDRYLLTHSCFTHITSVTATSQLIGWMPVCLCGGGAVYIHRWSSTRSCATR